VARPSIRLFVLGAALLAACSRSAPPAPNATSASVRGGTLIASFRGEPNTFNRLGPDANTAAVDALTLLTHAPLVRVNRATGAIEPWLAERWTTSSDGRSLTLALRSGVTFSDGVPFTSADVLFTFRALYDPSVNSALASGIQVQRRPLQVSAPDARTVIVTLPAPFASGLALLDSLPIYPKHQLEAALDAHTFARAWGTTTPPGSMAGLGPFVLTGYAPGQRVTFSRNPHYWRKDASGAQLPYLDGVVIEDIKLADTEMLRLETGSIDVMTLADVQPQDIAALRRLRDQGAVQLVDVGVGVDPNFMWFNLVPGANPAKPYLQKTEFRQAISYAVDRDAIANTVYLGAAVPVYGPITPGNRTWYSDAAPKYPRDLDRARTLLAKIGLTKGADGLLHDSQGRPVRFSILTHAGHPRERVATMVQAQLREIGITVDVDGRDVASIFERYGRGDYESIYFGLQASAFDPAMNLDFWLSSGSAHVWNPQQRTPATSWEAQIDQLMLRQASAPTLDERQRLFAQVQQIFGENVPALYFVAPKVSVAMSRRVGGAVPVLLDPKVLWSPDTLYLRR
jgi:peptide/nickel transport system substrate-binding protein